MRWQSSCDASINQAWTSTDYTKMSWCYYSSNIKWPLRHHWNLIHQSMLMMGQSTSPSTSPRGSRISIKSRLVRTFLAISVSSMASWWTALTSKETNWILRCTYLSLRSCTMTPMNSQTSSSPWTRGTIRDSSWAMLACKSDRSSCRTIASITYYATTRTRIWYWTRMGVSCLRYAVKASRLER